MSETIGGQGAISTVHKTTQGQRKKKTTFFLAFSGPDMTPGGVEQMLNGLKQYALTNYQVTLSITKSEEP